MLKSNNVSLLYVDDETINLFLFEKSFRSLYKVYTASSGREGLQVLDDRKNEIIVVISDFRMPLMDGVEFIRNAHKHHKNIAYFILTGYPSNEEIDSAINEGIVSAYFTKPFEVGDMHNSINQYITDLGLESNHPNQDV